MEMDDSCRIEIEYKFRRDREVLQGPEVFWKIRFRIPHCQPIERIQRVSDFSGYTIYDTDRVLPDLKGTLSLTKSLIILYASEREHTHQNTGDDDSQEKTDPEKICFFKIFHDEKISKSDEKYVREDIGSNDCR